MCDKDFTSPTSLDITDLLEYDEFQTYDEPLSSTTNGSSLQIPDAVPLSEELAEAVAAQASEQHQSDDFSKSAPLFLRLEDSDGIASVSNRATTSTAARQDSADEIDDAAAGFPLGAGIELQYENEFDENNGDGSEDGFGHFGGTMMRSYHSMAENENEQLLMEGSSGRIVVL